MTSIRLNILLTKHYNIMKRICDVTGIKTNTKNFYKNQSHIKAVDNITGQVYSSFTIENTTTGILIVSFAS